MSGDDALARRIAEAVHVECPVHGMRDCSPLLNGCSWPSTLKTQEERAVEAAREHYQPLVDEADEMVVAFEGCMHRMTEDEPVCGVCPFCRYRAVRDERG